MLQSASHISLCDVARVLYAQSMPESGGTGLLHSPAHTSGPPLVLEAMNIGLLHYFHYWMLG